MRILFEFYKGPRLRFVSLLDMQRLMQRALRRSGLPIRYSGGYSPHAAMSFASALGVGSWSSCEVLDVKMERECPLKEAFDRMNAALPDDMHITRVSSVEDGHTASMAKVRWADYAITLPEEYVSLADAARELLDEKEIKIMRKGKAGTHEMDVRPLIASLTTESRPDGGAVVYVRLGLSEQGTLKPDLMMNLAAERRGVEIEPGALDIERRALLTGDDPAGARPIITDGVIETYPA